MNITAERLDRGLSLEGAAREIGIDRKTLDKAEGGLSIHPASAKKIADFYGVRVTDLWPVDPDRPVAA